MGHAMYGIVLNDSKRWNCVVGEFGVFGYMMMDGGGIDDLLDNSR